MRAEVRRRRGGKWVSGRKKLGEKERVERVKRYRGDVRCDGSWAKDGSRVIDLSPLWLPSGCVCLSAGTCVLVSLQLYSRPPCALNTTGCRSKSLERGLPVNGFPVHHGVTHEYSYLCVHTYTDTHIQTRVNQACQPSCLIKNAFLYQACAATLSAHNTQAMQHTDVPKIINISIKHNRHKPCGGNHHLCTYLEMCQQYLQAAYLFSLFFFYFLACCCHLNLIV